MSLTGDVQCPSAKELKALEEDFLAIKEMVHKSLSEGASLAGEASLVKNPHRYVSPEGLGGTSSTELNGTLDPPPVHSTIRRVPHYKRKNASPFRSSCSNS